MKYMYSTSQILKLSLTLCTFSITGSVAGLFLTLLREFLIHYHIPISFIHLQSLANSENSSKEITIILLNSGIVQATASGLFTIQLIKKQRSLISLPSSYANLHGTLAEKMNTTIFSTAGKCPSKHWMIKDIISWSFLIITQNQSNH